MGLAAVTPPWELKKQVVLHAVNRSKGKARMMLKIDVKKAHLASEFTKDGQGGKVRRWLHGFRPAAAACEAHHENKLEEVGFGKGLPKPVSFLHEGKDVILVVHGDDFTFTSNDARNS